MVRAGLVCCSLFVSVCSAADPVDFARDIEPLLQKHCLVCHGPQQQMSGLRLDQKEAALKGGASGQDIKPGDSAGSRLIRLVTGADGKVMPPVGARLTAAEIESLRAWIDQGAPWSAGTGSAATGGHWAFQKIQRPNPPAVRDGAWPRNAVDNFILARLEKEGIAPSPEAGKTRSSGA